MYVHCQVSLCVTLLASLRELISPPVHLSYSLSHLRTPSLCQCSPSFGTRPGTLCLQSIQASHTHTHKPLLANGKDGIWDISYEQLFLSVTLSLYLSLSSGWLNKWTILLPCRKVLSTLGNPLKSCPKATHGRLALRAKVSQIRQ